MGMGVIVNGFNKVAGALSTVVTPVSSYLGRLDYCVKKMAGAGDAKTFFVRPAMVLGASYKFFYPEKYLANQYPGFIQWTETAKVVKSFLGAVDVLPQTGKMLKALSTEIGQQNKEGTKWNLSREVAYMSDGKAHLHNATLSPLALVAQRLSSVALWLINVGDAVNEIGEYHSISPFLKKYVPIMFSAAGLYMGVQGLYEEKMVRNSVKAKKFVMASEENHYSYAKHALNWTFVFVSAVGGLGIYFEKNPPKWLPTTQFIGTAALAAMLIAHKVLGDRVEDLQKRLKKEKDI